MVSSQQISSWTGVARAAGFLAIWIVLSGVEAADLAVGVLTAILAAGVSFRLLPSRVAITRPYALLQLAGHVMRQSLSAGLDVAWRAFHPSCPLRPGFATYTSRFPRGTKQTTFLTMESLLPGTLPVGHDSQDCVLVHCLDTTLPIAAQMSADEAVFAHVLKEPHRHA